MSTKFWDVGLKVAVLGASLVLTFIQTASATSFNFS
jgi:hypothetical protein